MAANIYSADASGYALELSRLIAAPRPPVFSVWTRPEHLTKWWGPDNFTLPFCETDFRVGGEYRFCMLSPDGEEHWVWGVYEEINEPERLMFSWNRDDIGGRPRRNSLVTVTFDDRDGKTLLTLRHSHFDNEWDRDDHEIGWTQCLRRLDEYASRRG